MKNFKLYIIVSVLMSSLFVSCEPEPTNYDETMLYGEWISGTVHYTYYSNGTGGTWDTADDVGSGEAQEFTWTLDVDQLTLIHRVEAGQTVLPKYYTVTELTATTLKYKDEFGGTESFTKVSN